MLGFFKTELFSTFDLNAYNHVKLVLKQAGIPYYVRSSNTTSNRSPHNLMAVMSPVSARWIINMPFSIAFWYAKRFRCRHPRPTSAKPLVRSAPT